MKNQKTETNARRLIKTITTSLCSVLLTGAAILFAPGTGISQTTDPKVDKEGMASVNLVDKSVIVANTELVPVQVRDINRKPTTPVHASALIQTGEPQSSSVIYTVPEGKRLVIEFITAEADLDGSSPGFRVSVAAHLGTATMLHFYLTFSPLTGSNRFGFTGMTKIYADTGNVRIHLLMSPPATTSNTLRFSFTGYLEDL